MKHFSTSPYVFQSSLCEQLFRENTYRGNNPIKIAI
jgi:hypothetical protein